MHFEMSTAEDDIWTVEVMNYLSRDCKYLLQIFKKVHVGLHIDKNALVR